MVVKWLLSSNFQLGFHNQNYLLFIIKSWQVGLAARGILCSFLEEVSNAKISRSVSNKNKTCGPGQKAQNSVNDPYFVLCWTVNVSLPLFKLSSLKLPRLLRQLSFPRVCHLKYPSGALESCIILVILKHFKSWMRNLIAFT